MVRLRCSPYRDLSPEVLRLADISFFSFLPSILLSTVGELPLSLLRRFVRGGAGVLVAECWNDVEQGGGGQFDVKGPNGRPQHSRVPQRREERGEQQALALQGPTVLPPPPPMDYGVFMQGLAPTPAPVPQEHGHGGPSIMERFKRMAPPPFKGESLVESWMREVEKIFLAIRCAEEGKVSLATYMLQALSAACRQESEMDQYIEEKRAAQKRSTPPFQRQDRKKAAVY
ncbi:hypothetical protein Taro_008973 [Colocasia esculenta]|uniref:Uncharacterized protein n=1 Tax=Colocasia esculenta TaxID=4460 RepID=A0A843TYU8_COLES|nr:hypothetical protein [Colocasia esculenta]